MCFGELGERRRRDPNATAPTDDNSAVHDRRRVTGSSIAQILKGTFAAVLVLVPITLTVVFVAIVVAFFEACSSFELH